MQKRYLNTIILALLILAPLTYATTIHTAPNKTNENTTKTPTTTPNETTFKTQQYPYGPPYEPVYYMDWDWTYSTQPWYGNIINAFGYKGSIIVETSDVIMQLGGWIRELPGYDVYLPPMQKEYYFFDGSTLYVYDLETGETLYEATVGIADIYAVGNYYAGDGLTDVVGYDSVTSALYVWTITGAAVGEIDLIALTGATYVVPVWYFGGDFYSEYAGYEILLYLAYDIGGGRYNISLATLSLENIMAPAIIDDYQIASNVDDYGWGSLADINGDGINEALISYENESKMWIQVYNVTEGSFTKLSEFSMPTSYSGYLPTFIWVNDLLISSVLNGTHMYVANLTSGDYWEIAIPENYTENTYYWTAVPGYIGETLVAAIFADKMSTATNDTGLLKLYVLNVTNGEEIWNITLGEGMYYYSENWYVVSSVDKCYIFNEYGPYFEVDLATGEYALDLIPVNSLYNYRIVDLGNGYYLGYVGYGYFELFSFTEDASLINYGWANVSLFYSGLGAIDYDGDGSPEVLMISNAEGYSYGYNYYWFDVVDLQIEEQFGYDGLRDDVKIYDLLAVNYDEKLALISAKNFTAGGVWYFGWYNWSSGSWYMNITGFDLGSYIWVSDNVIICTYRNITSGEDYLAKVNTETLGVIDQVLIGGNYPNTDPWKMDLLLTDFNGDGVDDVMIIPINTDDSVISVYSTDLTFMFSYTLGDNQIKYYGEGDFDNDGEPELYFLTYGSGWIYMFEKHGLELMDYTTTYYYLYFVSVYNIFKITYPGLGDVLLISYIDGTLEVIYYDTLYEMVWEYTKDVGDTVESVWLSGDGSKLVVITSYWNAVTFDARDIEHDLSWVDSIDIFWPLYVDLYPSLPGIPSIFKTWFSGDVLYLTIGSPYYTSTMEYYETMIMNVYYYPDFNAPEIIAIQDTTVANNVIQFDYGASDDLWLGYIYITATYTLADGSVKVVEVAEQPAYMFGNSYYSTLILTLPPDIASDIVSVTITLNVTDLIWRYYDHFDYQPSRHESVSYAMFQIDLIAPELHVTYPVNGSSFTLSKSDSIELSVRVIENSMEPVNVLININNKYAFYVTTFGDFTITIPATALVSGSNVIVIKATDVAGNEATIRIVIDVTFTEPAEAAARAASTASVNSLASGIIAVFVALLALGIAVIRRS